MKMNLPPSFLGRVSQKESIKMTIVLDSTFATAEDTARELGVPKTRLHRLVRMATAQGTESKRSSGKKFSYKNGTRVLGSARKRKSARGKAKKVAR